MDETYFIKQMEDLENLCEQKDREIRRLHSAFTDLRFDYFKNMVLVMRDTGLDKDTIYDRLIAIEELSDIVSMDRIEQV